MQAGGIGYGKPGSSHQKKPQTGDEIVIWVAKIIELVWVWSGQF
jgi:hypothetical protein